MSPARAASIGTAGASIMDPQLQSQVAFHLTGKRSGTLPALDVRRLRPALFARYRDLTQLRYDFPVVLLEEGPEEEFAEPLSHIVDRLLRELAPRGIAGERLRRHVLRLEREIRALAAEGVRGPLSELWQEAARRGGGARDAEIERDLAQARAALRVEGEVLDCDGAMPERLIAHAWRRVQQRKARHFREEAGALLLRLSDILRADLLRSGAGCSPAALRAAVGTVHQQSFDFDALSRLLARVAARDALPERRRRRIEWAAAVLRAQRFFPLGNGQEPGAPARAHEFVFDSCGEALEAFRARLPEMIELLKAMAVAELEVEGRYVESKHDAFFEHFDERALGPRDLALFPDYLVCLRPRAGRSADHARLLELLSSPLPAKVLALTDDVIEEPTLGDGHFPFGVRSASLAAAVVNLGDVYVLQSCSAHLPQLRTRIHGALTRPGRALFSVFCGPPPDAAALPTYLVSAAAMESRAFPAFSYDPEGGADWPSRFRLEDNPQPESDWPVHDFSYEDAEHQRVGERLAFTFVDFAACDARHAAHFAEVPPAQWGANLAPVADCLGAASRAGSDKVPYVLLVDEHNLLRRAIVDSALLEAARRAREHWNKLQELGGVRNPYTEKLLARERAAWEEEKRRALEALRAAPPAPQPAAAAAPAAEPAPAPAPAATSEERSPDEPYIETARCTTCEECMRINNRMFAYDENKQAYIADLSAGTYRELVEAAEACQVSIIHPGKPRNMNEPGIEELMRRAAAFN